MSLKVDGFTISYSVDGNAGRRSNSFVSVNFKLPEPTSIEDLEPTRLEASKKVTVWALQDALMRGEIDQETATERMKIVSHNHEKIQEALDRKKNQKENT